jgi:hypothetical protein
MSQELDPSDSGTGAARTMVTIVATLTGVSAMFVVARLFVRVKLRSLGLDDYLIVLAMVIILRHTLLLVSRHADNHQDLCLCQSGHLQCSSRIRQRSTFQYSKPGRQTICHQIHYGCILSRSSLVCNPQTFSSGVVDQAFEPKSGASDVFVVFHIADNTHHIRVCHHFIRAMHTFAFTVGLFG